MKKFTFEEWLLFAFISLAAFAALTFLFSLQSFLTDLSLDNFLRQLPHLLAIKAAISSLLGFVVVYLMFSPALSGIKAVSVGDGQYGTARWATKQEKRAMFDTVRFSHETKPGVVTEATGGSWEVDTSDQTIMLVAPPGAGKTTSMIIPTIYYNTMINKRKGAVAPSMVLTDCKGELFSRCGSLLKECGYRTPFLDFRNPLKSYRFNLLTGINRHMDNYLLAKTESDRILSYGRAERYGILPLVYLSEEKIMARARQNSSPLYLGMFG